MEFEVTRGLVQWLAPILGIHSGIGLLIVAAFMYLRSDSVLKLFGVGIGLLAVPLLMGGILAGLHLPEESVRGAWGCILGTVTILPPFVFFVVGSSDYTPRWRRIALATAVVWVLGMGVLEMFRTQDAVVHYSDAGFLYVHMHGITYAWFLVGFFVAFLEAVHITVEHSHGEPYRSILIAAMSMFAVSVAVDTLAGEKDMLRLVNMLVTSLVVGVMWVAVVVHERKELAAERAAGETGVEAGVEPA